MTSHLVVAGKEDLHLVTMLDRTSMSSLFAYGLVRIVSPSRSAHCMLSVTMAGRALCTSLTQKQDFDASSISL